MPKYLSRTSYTAEGLEGLLKDGGTKKAGDGAISRELRGET